MLHVPTTFVSSYCLSAVLVHDTLWLLVNVSSQYLVKYSLWIFFIYNKRLLVISWATGHNNHQHKKLGDDSSTGFYLIDRKPLTRTEAHIYTHAPTRAQTESISISPIHSAWWGIKMWKLLTILMRSCLPVKICWLTLWPSFKLRMPTGRLYWAMYTASWFTS